MRTMNIIMNESKQHPFVSCEKCKLRFINKDHYFTENISSEDKQSEAENRDANLTNLTWNEIVQKFNEKFNSTKSL